MNGCILYIVMKKSQFGWQKYLFLIQVDIFEFMLNVVNIVFVFLFSD
jgi:hypothetical protein